MVCTFGRITLSGPWSGPRIKSVGEKSLTLQLLRNLDCSTIEFMHEEILSKTQADMKDKGFSDFKIFDSTRGAFIEGGPAFEGSGLHAKTHIQICIRNMNCIKGFFLPRREIDFVQSLQAG